MNSTGGRRIYPVNGVCNPRLSQNISWQNWRWRWPAVAHDVPTEEPLPSGCWGDIPVSGACSLSDLFQKQVRLVNMGTVGSTVYIRDAFLDRERNGRAWVFQLSEVAFPRSKNCTALCSAGMLSEDKYQILAVNPNGLRRALCWYFIVLLLQQAGWCQGQEGVIMIFSRPRIKLVGIIGLKLGSV
ncbi:hypothetical protein L211DRAFT_285803 [Terfezia boudieri ATCC MYA-4762]|uniref:Uncharacterized protein n=1 Tax=Terfezia boudieri ATCC MYA-4762 TaxID=1051890 RepID=A0A3N4LKK1_9PEZI|nr:hypothetical protein L211DRAFT_285803 [Terfezia boudieri ATCC MYA-4762]